MYAAQLPKHCEAAGHSFTDLSPHRGVRFKIDSEVTDRVHWSDVVVANSDRDTRKLLLTTTRRRPEKLGLGGVELSSSYKCQHSEVSLPTVQDAA